MKNEKLIMRALDYLIWVHRPRSKPSQELKEELLFQLQLILNPQVPDRIPSDKNASEIMKSIMEEKRNENENSN